MLLELVSPTPDWMSALQVALALPRDMTERRQRGQDPLNPPSGGPRRRVSDDLAWLRGAYDEPEQNGLHALDGTAVVAAFTADEDPELCARLQRLEQRGVLAAAGFLLHEFELALS